MVDIAFHAFIQFCIFVIPISLTCVLLCIRWAPELNNQSSSMDSDYYVHEIYSVDQDDAKTNN